MITKDMIQYGLEHGLVILEEDPNGDGTVCRIGDNWFYFDEEADIPPVEYQQKFDRVHIGDQIFYTLEEMLNEDETEYLYYEFFLSERIQPRYAVVITYSFDPDVPIRLFHAEDAAIDYLMATLHEEIRIDIEENGWNSEFTLSGDRHYASITTHFPDHDDMTEFRITSNIS